MPEGLAAGIVESKWMHTYAWKSMQMDAHITDIHKFVMLITEDTEIGSCNSVENCFIR